MRRHGCGGDGGGREHVRGDQFARVYILCGNHDSDLAACLGTIGEDDAEREHDQERDQGKPDAEHEKRGPYVGGRSRSGLPDRCHLYDFSSGGTEATQRLPSQ